MPTIGMRLAEDRRHGIREVVLDADVDRRVVHVVLDAFAEHELHPEHVVSLPALRFELTFKPQPVASAREVELVVERRRPT